MGRLPAWPRRRYTLLLIAPVRKPRRSLRDRFTAWWNAPDEPWKVSTDATGRVVAIIDTRGVDR